MFLLFAIHPRLQFLVILKMKGSSIIKYLPHKFYGKSLNIMFLKKQDKRKRQNNLFGFNDQIIKGGSSCAYLLERKEKLTQSLQIKRTSEKQATSNSFFLNSSRSKEQPNVRQQAPKCLNYKVPQLKRIRVHCQGNYRSLNRSFQKQKLPVSQNQLIKSASFKDEYQNILKSTFFVKRYPQSVQKQGKNRLLAKKQRQRTLQRVEPWNTNKETLTQTIKFKTEEQKSESSQNKKSLRLKKMMHKFN